MIPIIVIIVILVLMVVGVVVWLVRLKALRREKNYERGLTMVPILIHLPPSTDDIQSTGRDERDINNEAISEAQVMYSIIASTVEKGLRQKIYGQKHIGFEIMVTEGVVRYYALVPVKLAETVKQAILSAYPTARLEEAEQENIFSEEGKIGGVAGGELRLKKEFYYPIATFEELKWDATAAMLNAFSKVGPNEGMVIQILLRPTDGTWVHKSTEYVKKIKDGKTKINNTGLRIVDGGLGFMRDMATAVWKPPEEKEKEKTRELTNLEEEAIKAIEEKTRFPAFETIIRIVASTTNKSRSEVLVGGIVAAFAQFDTSANNGFKYEMISTPRKLVKNYVLRLFPQSRNKDILNSVELASIFHLPSQNVIPTSQVERQLTKQVDGPAQLVTDGVLLGINEFRGVKKEIRLSENDRRRHVYVIGSTGMGKSVFMRNIALQDMQAGRGFAFIDPHGDVVEELLSMVPPERVDDVVYFDPGDIEHPIGMNMFEFTTEDQKDFIVQEGINMLQSLYDPTNQGFFGPRGQHMFRNAALLLMSDPAGATFIDIPKCFIDAEFVKKKLKYVTDKSVYDYWTKEYPESRKSSDSGEVVTWFASKWGPFLSNTMMKNILGQTKSGFNLREMMDQKKILLVNLSKGKVGEVNSKLLGMIFVMKFQAAAMSRVDTPEDERNDFCLFVDEFQNFSTESFESILSEARKFRLNLVVANQFMTQLTEKIREGVLGNVGTIVAGRLGVTDAQIMEKVFTPVFNAEDLHKTPNHNAIATVMMFGMPSSPFTMTWPKLGKENWELMKHMKEYSAARHSRPREEVEAEINARLAEQNGGSGEGGDGSAGDVGGGSGEAGGVGIQAFDVGGVKAGTVVSGGAGDTGGAGGASGGAVAGAGSGDGSGGGSGSKTAPGGSSAELDGVLSGDAGSANGGASAPARKKADDNFLENWLKKKGKSQESVGGIRGDGGGGQGVVENTGTEAEPAKGQELGVGSVEEHGLGAESKTGSGVGTEVVTKAQAKAEPQPEEVVFKVR